VRRRGHDPLPVADAACRACYTRWHPPLHKPRAWRRIHAGEASGRSFGSGRSGAGPRASKRGRSGVGCGRSGIRSSKARTRLRRWSARIGEARLSRRPACVSCARGEQVSCPRARSVKPCVSRARVGSAPPACEPGCSIEIELAQAPLRYACFSSATSASRLSRSRPTVTTASTLPARRSSSLASRSARLPEALISSHFSACPTYEMVTS